MVTPLAAFVTVVGALVLLYVLIKVHVRLIRRTWRPIWEDENENEEPPAETEDEHRAWDEVR